MRHVEYLATAVLAVGFSLRYGLLSAIERGGEEGKKGLNKEAMDQARHEHIK